MANTVRSKILRDEEGNVISSAKAIPNMLREDINKEPVPPPVRSFTNDPTLANTSVPNAPGNRYEFVSEDEFEPGGKYDTTYNESYTAPIPASGGTGYVLNPDPAMQDIIKIINGEAIKNTYQKQLDDLYTEFNAGKAPAIESLPEPPPKPVDINNDVPGAPTPIVASPTPPTRMGLVTFEDRERFRNQVIQNQLGGVDPYTLDPSKVMNEWVTQNEDKLFEDMTGLAKEYKDRLPAKAREIWDKALITQASAVKKTVEDRKTTGIKMLADMLGRFDKRAKEGQEQYKAASQPPKEEYRVNAAGKQTLHKWDESARTWVDTGTEKPQASTITAGERLKYTKLENETINPVDEDGDPLRDPDEPVSPASLKLLNDQRAILQMPPLVEKKDKEGNYQYIEQTQDKSTVAPGNARQVSEIYNEEDITAITRNPAVYLGSDGFYYINNALGQPLRIKPKAKKGK